MTQRRSPSHTVDVFHDLQQALRASLATRSFGRSPESRWLGRVDSTNRIARELARAGAPEGTVIVAEEQVAGRGRMQRRWHAPYGSSILVSLLLRPPGEVSASLLPFVAAVALAETLEQEYALRPALKWPNDVQIGGRKLAGILAESEYVGDRLDAVVTGVGLNCDVEADTLAALGTPATSLLVESGRSTDRPALLAAWLGYWERHYLALLDGQSPLPAWRQRAALLGEVVEVRPGGAALWWGLALDVTERGALLVRDEAGITRAVHAGEVSLRKKEESDT